MGVYDVYVSCPDADFMHGISMACGFSLDDFGLMILLGEGLKPHTLGIPD